MPTFRVMRKIRPMGFHCHHLIPVEVLEMKSLALIVGKARSAGFDPDDFATNGMFLPNVERNAECFQLPLHRGAHPQYNALVAHRIADLGNGEPAQLHQQFHQLQIALAHGLRSPATKMLVAHPLRDSMRDPLRPAGDFRKIDGQINLLWTITDPGSAPLS
jgi:A nuclease family of the HNH/ENDO VII superfamily with conserved AHH